MVFFDELIWSVSQSLFFNKVDISYFCFFSYFIFAKFFQISYFTRCFFLIFHIWWIEGRFHISPVVKICSYFISPVSQQPHLSSSLSLSLSLSYTLLVCWAFTQPPMCISWSRLFRSFNPWFSHTTHLQKALFLNIIKNTIGNYLPYLLTIYLPTIYCQSGHK